MLKMLRKRVWDALENIIVRDGSNNSTTTATTTNNNNNNSSSSNNNSNNSVTNDPLKQYQDWIESHNGLADIQIDKNNIVTKIGVKKNSSGMQEPSVIIPECLFIKVKKEWYNNKNIDEEIALTIYIYKEIQKGKVSNLWPFLQLFIPLIYNEHSTISEWYNENIWDDTYYKSVYKSNIEYLNDIWKIHYKDFNNCKFETFCKQYQFIIYLSIYIEYNDSLSLIPWPFFITPYTMLPTEEYDNEYSDNFKTLVWSYINTTNDKTQFEILSYKYGIPYMFNINLLTCNTTPYHHIYKHQLFKTNKQYSIIDDLWEFLPQTIESYLSICTKFNYNLDTNSLLLKTQPITLCVGELLSVQIITAPNIVNVPSAIRYALLYFIFKYIYIIHNIYPTDMQ